MNDDRNGDPQREPRHLGLTRRSAGTIMVVIAYVGVISALVGAVVGWRFLGELSEANRQGLVLAEESLTAAQASLVVAEDVIEAVDGALTAVNGTIDAVGEGIGTTTAVAGSTGQPLRYASINGNISVAAGTRFAISQIAAGVFTGVSAVTSSVVTAVLVLVLSFFFIKDGPGFLPWLRRETGPDIGGHLTEVFSRSWNTLGDFIRVQAIVSFVDAFFIGLGLVVLGVPLAPALAVLTFFAGFIPIVGALAAGTLAVLVALVSKDLAERGVSAGSIIREIAPIVGGGGGGRDDMAQAGGKDPSKLDEALTAARAAIERNLT